MTQADARSWVKYIRELLKQQLEQSDNVDKNGKDSDGDMKMDGKDDDGDKTGGAKVLREKALAVLQTSLTSHYIGDSKTLLDALAEKKKKNRRVPAGRPTSQEERARTETGELDIAGNSGL